MKDGQETQIICLQNRNICLENGNLVTLNMALCTDDNGIIVAERKLYE